MEGVREGGKAILILMTEGRKERGTNSNTEDTLSRSYYLKIVERNSNESSTFVPCSLSLSMQLRIEPLANPRLHFLTPNPIPPHKPTLAKPTQADEDDDYRRSRTQKWSRTQVPRVNAPKKMPRRPTFGHQKLCVFVFVDDNGKGGRAGGRAVPGGRDGSGG